MATLRLILGLVFADAGRPAGDVGLFFGAFVAARWGVDAEGKSLEEIAPPLTSYDEQGNETTKVPV